MGKQSKSKRFSQHSEDAVRKHAERFPYKMRFSEAEREQEESDRHPMGGF
ncbi:hypothetical protein GCM10008983_07310 [Lentibacillus halophilus]|uniref:Competence protein n=1 Tax=Lentibacillus halophilus TaxID=295065 RepID=A0ABP3IZ21_9BACI